MHVLGITARIFKETGAFLKQSDNVALHKYTRLAGTFGVPTYYLQSCFLPKNKTDTIC